MRLEGPPGFIVSLFAHWKGCSRRGAGSTSMNTSSSDSSYSLSLLDASGPTSSWLSDSLIRLLGPSLVKRDCRLGFLFSESGVVCRNDLRDDWRERDLNGIFVRVLSGGLGPAGEEPGLENMVGAMVEPARRPLTP